MKILNAIIFIALTNFILNAQSDNEALWQKANTIHQKVITIDTHVDIEVLNFTMNRNYSMDLPNQVTIPKMKKGGLDVAWFIVYTGQGPLTKEGYETAYANAMSKFDAIHLLVEEFAPNDIGLATSSAEVRALVAFGKKVAMIGIENGYPIGEDLENVKKFYDLGARYMSMAHNGHSQLSDSNTGESDNIWLHNGLSKLGKDVVKEMNRLGMMIDVSHPSKEAMREMIELSKAPIIASHSSARALNDHSRNLDDEQLNWMKNNGGLVQTVAFRRYIDTKKNAAHLAGLNDIYQRIAKQLNIEVLDQESINKMDSKELWEYSKKLQRNFHNFQEINQIAAPQIERLKTDIPPVNVSDFVDHIDYLVEKIGINHVGISSDFDGNGGIEGWNDASETFNVTLELVKRGYTENEIAKLWGENLLRILDEVQSIAKNLQEQG